MRVKRAIATVHRWLGLALCALFASWFASGIVMTFAGFPEIGVRESADRAAPIPIDAVRLGPAAMLSAMPRTPDEVSLVSIGTRAVYRVSTAGQVVNVDADSGETLRELSPAEAIALGSTWLKQPVFPLERLEEEDQWTPQARERGQLPLLRARAKDAGGTEIYVSLSRGEVVQRTTSRTRGLAWVGAIPHWIYPIQLRRHAQAWRSLIIVLTALGAIGCGTGIVHGLRVARIGRRLATRARVSVSPFRDNWLRWHHLFGLTFGLSAFSWVLSGMLSLYPCASFAQAEPRQEESRLLRGASLTPDRFTRDIHEALWACAAQTSGVVKRVDVVLLGAVPFYVCTSGYGVAYSLRADTLAPPTPEFDRRLLTSAVRALSNDAATEAADWLTEPDAYYYPTHFDPELSFPVLRMRFSSGVLLYVSPASGTVLRRFSNAGAVYRWIYPGLHSLDFPILYRHPAVWHLLIVVFAVGGGLLALSGVAAFGRRLWRNRGRQGLCSKGCERL